MTFRIRIELYLHYFNFTFFEQIVAGLLCLVVLTAHAIPAPQGLFERVIERGVELGVERAAEYFQGQEFGGGGYRENGNYGSYGGGSGYDYYGQE